MIAASASISKSGALHIFQSGIHCSPVAYLIQYRLAQAARQHYTTQKSVASIATETGFTSAGYFCRKFRQNYNRSPKENRKSYKEECSVFLSHRKRESLWERISIWKEDVICIYQRLRYGYCYRDIWSIDQWFLTVVPNMIHDLRVNSHGYPSFFEGPEEENIRKWDRILGRMEFLFREANEDTCRKKNLYEEEHDLAQEEFTTKYGMFGEKLKTEEEIAREKREHTHRLYMMSDVPEYVEISGKWLAAEGELREYRDQCLKQGMELMTKYFRNLWD